MTKVLIRLHGCAGWSAPLLFAYGAYMWYLLTRCKTPDSAPPFTTKQQNLAMINFSYVTFSPTYFLRLTYMLVYINAQRWPKVTTDECKRNRLFTVYGSIEKTLLDNWCVFVTINWINRSFKWIPGTDRQQHMNWTAFWWHFQRAHDRRSRPNLCRSGRKLSITRPIVQQNFASRIQLWNGKCCSFLNKNLILAFILCAKIYKEP